MGSHSRTQTQDRDSDLDDLQSATALQVKQLQKKQLQTLAEGGFMETPRSTRTFALLRVLQTWHIAAEDSSLQVALEDAKQDISKSIGGLDQVQPWNAGQCLTCFSMVDVIPEDAPAQCFTCGEENIRVLDEEPAQWSGGPDERAQAPNEADDDN